MHVDTACTVVTRPELYSCHPSNGKPDKSTRSLLHHISAWVGGKKGWTYFCDPSESMQYRLRELVACISQYLTTTDKMKSSEHLTKGWSPFCAFVGGGALRQRGWEGAWEERNYG